MPSHRFNHVPWCSAPTLTFGNWEACEAWGKVTLGIYTLESLVALLSSLEQISECCKLKPKHVQSRKPWNFLAETRHSPLFNHPKVGEYSIPMECLFPYGGTEHEQTSLGGQPARVYTPTHSLRSTLRSTEKHVVPDGRIAALPPPMSPVLGPGVLAAAAAALASEPNRNAGAIGSAFRLGPAPVAGRVCSSKAPPVRLQSTGVHDDLFGTWKVRYIDSFGVEHELTQ